jgi:glycosyltransferase involved in cell wall biosynthesis
MTQKKFVSVIVPTFNRGYCLPDTIRSVLAQTHQDFEIIVVDDGSTDGTREILAREFPGEARIRFFHQKNRGVSVARNLGIDRARGALIALLDSDDNWLPWKLEAQLACLERYPSAVMVHTEMQAVDESERVFDQQFLRTIYDVYQRFTLPEMYPESCQLSELLPNAQAPERDAKVWFGDIFSHTLTGNLAHTSTLLIARSADGSIEHYDETMRTEETFGFHLRVAKRGPVVFLDTPTIRYRRGRNDHLWDPQRGYEPHLQHLVNSHFLHTVEPHIKAAGPRMRVSAKELNLSLARAHSWLAASALGIGQPSQMLQHLAKSLRLQPWQPRLVARLLRNALRAAPKARPSDKQAQEPVASHT